MSITSPVDEVTRASELEKERPLLSVLNDLAPDRVVTCTHPEQPLLEPAPDHPLFAAARLAFNQHRPLVLSPDAVWLTLAQGFSNHVNTNAEALRDRFVRHEGEKELTVDRVSLATREDWAETVEQLCRKISSEVGPGLHNLVRCDFTTTTPETRTASDVVLMGAMQRYFKYWVGMICGIPEVTLLGTPDDWRSIEKRIEILFEYDLAWWAEWIRPVCEQLRRTSEGDIDQNFWESIYMPQEVYGGRIVLGWINRLFPYSEWSELERGMSRTAAPDPGQMLRNWSLRPWNPDEDGFGAKPVKHGEKRRKWLCGGGGGSFRGLSRVPVRIQDPAGNLLEEIQLLSGFIGVTQDHKTMAVQPHVGWAVISGADVVQPQVVVR